MQDDEALDRMEREALPLHARVAMALGWTSLRAVGRILLPGEPMGYAGRPPGNLMIGPAGEERVPRYDADWGVTGPLMCRNGFSLAPHGEDWRASLDVPNGYGVMDELPLRAICRLIVALAARKQ